MELINFFVKIIIMKINFMSRTALGGWAVKLIAAMPVLFVAGSLLANIFYKSVPAGNIIWEDIALRPILAFAMLIGMVCGISAFITGLIAIIKQKERALSVYIAVGMGGLLLFLLIGEFIFPH